MSGIKEISSRDNERLREARRVRDGKQLDKIFVEGTRLVEEAVRSDTRIDCLFVTKGGLARAAELIDLAGARDVYQLSDSAFQSISDTVTSQGVALLAERPTTARPSLERRLKIASVPLVVFLYQINNPSNLGAVIRTVEAAGAAGVIVSTRSADAFSPKAVRAAMGSSFRLPIWSDVDLGDGLVWAERNRLGIVAADTAATKSYSQIDWKAPRMVVIGSEAHGLPETERRKVSDLISIPIEESVESLNLAVACGVILFEARRQNISS